EGDPGTCGDRDLPEDGERIALAYSSERAALLRDLGDTGVWVPWFEAVQEERRVAYAWAARLGVAGEEAEEWGPRCCSPRSSGAAPSPNRSISGSRPRSS